MSSVSNGLYFLTLQLVASCAFEVRVMRYLSKNTIVVLRIVGVS